MEVYDLKINIFEANPTLPPFVKRFINCYGGRPIFEDEMAFYFYTERNRRMKRGEDKERACRMAEEMVNDLVLLLAKENFIWDCSIKVIERYPDATAITPEFIEFWGGLQKLREDLKPFFNIELERRLKVFHEKPSTAKFMAGHIVNWMAIRLARENGFLEIKEVVQPDFTFKSLKKEESEDPVPTTVTVTHKSDDHYKQVHQVVAHSRWHGAFGTNCHSHGATLLFKDVLSFITNGSTQVNIKGLLALKDDRMAVLLAQDYGKATLSVRLSMVTKKVKSPTDIKAYTKDVGNADITDIATAGRLVPFNSKLYQQDDGQPINWAVRYIDRLMAGHYLANTNLGPVNQVISQIIVLDTRIPDHVRKALNPLHTLQWHRQNAQDLVPRITMITGITLLSPAIMTLVKSLLWALNMNTIPLRVNNIGSLTYYQTGIPTSPRIRDEIGLHPWASAINKTNFNLYFEAERTIKDGLHDNREAHTLAAREPTSQQDVPNAKQTIRTNGDSLTNSEYQAITAFGQTQKKVSFGGMDATLLSKKDNYNDAAVVTVAKCKKASKLARFRKMLRRLCCCARNGHDDDE